jgi:proline-specific peptidase
MTAPATETFVNVEDGYKVWTKSIGGGSKFARAPLLVLHGGPGMAHDYLDNLEILASDTQKVVFYDQLGCGRSDTPDDPQRWKVSRFVNEVDMVRHALHLDKVVILGQSWGGMLAIEYLLTKPKGVRGAILSNSLSSAPLMNDEIQRLLRDLLGTQPSPDEKTVAEFYARHILRLQPFPKKILKKMEETNQVYEVMWGKNEFTVTGNLKDWNRTKDLPCIKLPIQIISGEFDESTPKVNQVLKDELPNANWIMMQGCSHLPNFEKPDEYLAIIQRFLDRLHT